MPDPVSNIDDLNGHNLSSDPTLVPYDATNKPLVQVQLSEEEIKELKTLCRPGTQIDGFYHWIRQKYPFNFIQGALAFSYFMVLSSQILRRTSDAGPVCTPTLNTQLIMQLIILFANGALMYSAGGLVKENHQIFNKVYLTVLTLFTALSDASILPTSITHMSSVKPNQPCHELVSTGAKALIAETLLITIFYALTLRIRKSLTPQHEKKIPKKAYQIVKEALSPHGVDLPPDLITYRQLSQILETLPENGILSLKNKSFWGRLEELGLDGDTLDAMFGHDCNCSINLGPAECPVRVEGDDPNIYDFSPLSEAFRLDSTRTPCGIPMTRPINISQLPGIFAKIDEKISELEKKQEQASTDQPAAGPSFIYTSSAPDPGISMV